MLYWERRERNRSYLIEVLPRNWPGGTEGNREESIRIFSVPAEIRTGSLLSAVQKRTFCSFIESP